MNNPTVCDDAFHPSGPLELVSPTLTVAEGARLKRDPFCNSKRKAFSVLATLAVAFTTIMWGAGSDATAAVTPADLGGRWSPTVPWPIIPIHVALTPQGKVMSYGTTLEGEQSGLLNFDIWDPALGTGHASHSTLDNGTSTDLFCSVQVIDPINDVIFTAGGDNGIPGESEGTNTVTTYSEASGLNPGQSMRHARWYPTGTTLPNGEVLIQGGSTDGVQGDGILTPEIFSPSTGWRELTGIQSAYAYGNDQTRWWYPRSWVMPDGDVFGIAGSNMYKLHPSGNGWIEEVGHFPGDNIGATSTAVMFRPGKILQVGGGAFHNEDYDRLGSTAATIVDINGTLPILAPAAPMANPRHWATAIVLPDGKVLVSGGSEVQNSKEGAVAFQPEIWDPLTNSWTTLNPHENTRLYHSTSLLLPDGRVFVGGGGQPGPDLNLNAEILSPPYLFDGDDPAPRPVISAPSVVSYGEAVAVSVSADVTRVTLVRAGATTHSVDSGTRWMELEMTGSGVQRVVAAPADANTAPPGSYMMFALTADGTPSVAAMVEINPA